jgi:hypothetical protein
MVELGRDWRTYYPGQLVKCPGHRVGSGRRARDRGSDRRQECRRVFLSVGLGEIYHVRWIGDKQNPVPVAIVGSKILCWDCDTWVEIKRTGT